MIRILNAEPDGYSPEARVLLARLGTCVDKALSRTELLNELNEYQVLITRLAHQIDQEVIEAGRSLKAIVSATTGLDHIDLDCAQARGIAVLSLRGETEFLEGINATSEHTWALLLGLLRRVVPASTSVRLGDWSRDSFRGHELHGRRLGIVGLGRVGRKVAGYGRAFGMEVGAFDPYALKWSENVWCASTLAQLLSWSEILSLHVPLNAETLGMIGENELALLPSGAVLINTSRGEVVDEPALVQALETKRLSGAALDVICHEREPAKRKPGLLLAYARTNDNLLITPHIGGATYESMAKAELFMARKLDHFLRSRGFINQTEKKGSQAHA
jgi:D-3-phosphoglycerate dehydrogenase